MNVKVSEHQEHPLRLGKYIAGFVLSVALTMAAYLLVTRAGLSKTATIAWISGLAVAQFVTQLVLFLHIGEERRPRWKQLVLWFMLGIVVIVVVGSLWIMKNLDYRMMTPEHTEQYLEEQAGF